MTVFTKNRERLLAGNIAIEFLTAVISDPAIKGLLSNEHFSVEAR